MKSYIDDLFKYIENYEKSYSQFETEAFLQTYNGIVTVFQTLRSDRNQAVEVDYYFLDKIKLFPLSSSDLRLLTVQVLITRFESEVDTDGRSNQAYNFCRNLRSTKQDVHFFENTLIQLLFNEGSLNNNTRLNAFFLGEMAAYINNFGKNVKSDLNPEEYEALSNPLKILELQRRRLALGADLLSDRSTLEFHLMRVDSFNRLGAIGSQYDFYLTRWNYLSKANFWAKCASWFKELGSKCKGAFSSFGYFRLLSAQRNLAYFLYLFIIVIFIALAIGIPSCWSNYTNDKLMQFQEKSNTLRKGK